MDFNKWRKVVNKLEEGRNEFGYIPSPPDKRDFQFRVFAGAQPLPKAFIRKDEMPAVRDQGSLGTCVGHAMWAIKEWQERQQGDNPVGGLSPRFIYQMAKQFDGIPNLAGTYPRVAFQVTKDYGDCAERDFPYSELKSDKNLPMPPQDVIEKAKPFKISAYARINTLDELKRAIVEQGPVMIGLYVTDSFVYANKFIPKPEGFLRGGHAIVACGYDDNIRLGNYVGGVLIMNSWGTSWADGGYCWIPYAAWLEPWWMDIEWGWKFIDEMWVSVDLPFDLTSAKHIIMKIGDKKVYVDGEYIEIDIPPTIIQDRTLVPIRFVAERMGYIVNWQDGTRIVELRKPNN